MKLHMTQRDYAVTLAGLVVPVIAAYAGLQYGFDPRLEGTMRFVMAFIILTAIVFIARAWQVSPPNIGRGLELVGIGLAITMLTYVPHIGYHLSQAPPWYGLGIGFWIPLFHVLGWVGYILVAYGFYHIWKSQA